MPLILIILIMLFICSRSMTNVVWPTRHNDFLIQVQLVQAIHINHAHLTPARFAYSLGHRSPYTYIHI